MPVHEDDWYEYDLEYSGPGSWCDETAFFDPRSKESDYLTRIYSLRFYYDEEDGSYSVYNTCFRINLPWDYGGDTSGATEGVPHEFGFARIGIALLVTGSGGTGVLCEEQHGAIDIETDDDIAALLAMGAVPYWSVYDRNALGRRGSPMVAVTFNRPSRGEEGTLPDGRGTRYNTRADGVAAYQNYAMENEGDDDGGPETTVLIEAVMQAVLEIVEDTYGGLFFSSRRTRVIASSFSNGAVGAARWIRYTSVPVHAFVDAEGPSDSVEKTMATECFDIFGEYGHHPAMPVTLGAETWAEAATARAFLAANASAHYGDRRAFRDKFGPALRGTNLPPVVVAEDWLDAYRSASRTGPVVFATRDVDYPADIDGYNGKLYGTASERRLKDALIRGAFGHGANSALGPVEGYVADVLDYWAERTLEDHLAALHSDCIYVRINAKFDHVQPRHYLNRHAVRAVVAAQSAMTGVCMADQDYWAAMQAAGDAGADPTAASSYASLDYDRESVIRDIWPDFVVDSHRNHVRVDLMRWAYDQV